MTARGHDKPPFAAWLTAERTKRGWKAEEVARRLRELGYAAEDTTYRTWEARSGRRPAPDTIRALERLFESVAPGDGAEASSSALTALVDELREWRTEDRVRIAALERTVEILLARVAPIEPAAEGPQGRSAPHSTAGSPGQ